MPGMQPENLLAREKTWWLVNMGLTGDVLGQAGRKVTVQKGCIGRGIVSFGSHGKQVRPPIA